VKYVGIFMQASLSVIMNLHSLQGELYLYILCVDCCYSTVLYCCFGDVLGCSYIHKLEVRDNWQYQTTLFILECSVCVCVCLYTHTYIYIYGGWLCLIVLQD
jgi:hypothetical protein